MSKPSKNSHGGARKNAGRRTMPDAEKQVRRNITLCFRLAEIARELGDGNLSEGIRKALERAEQHV